MQVRRAPIGRGPVLLVRWESRWCGFFSSLAVVLHRCRAPEFHAVPYGIPARGPLASILLHVAVVFFVLNLDPWLPRGWPDFNPVPIAPAASIANATVLYLPAGLPDLLDTSGAESGLEGTSGKGDLYDPKQVIRISRADHSVQSVVDAPTLRLPRTQKLVANLVAISPLAPVPPAESIERPLRTSSLQHVEVVAPPPDQAAGLSLRLQLQQPFIAPPVPEIDRTIHNPKLIVHLVEVVPPPPATNTALDLRGTKAGMVTVVPPSPAVRERSAGRLYAPNAIVAPPPPDVAHLFSGNKSIGLPATEVVPPPPATPVIARAMNTRDAVRVVPPPPVIDASNLPGRKVALASVLQPGATSTPVTTGLVFSDSRRPINAAVRDVIVSANAGDDIGTPDGGPGTLTLSPNGGSSVVTGPLSHAGAAYGTGPAIGESGKGFGEAHSGEGRGADPAARSGSVALPGPGGTNVVAGDVTPSGISVSGGVVHLPSFGSPRSPSPELSTPGDVPGIIVIATGRAGGALDPKMAPQGGRVYTVYLATRIGIAVLQYVDPDTSPSFQATLAPPQPLKTEIPSGLELTRAVIAGILDRLGALRDLRVVQADNPEAAAKLLSALCNWRFRPVLRSNNAVEVHAVLGFGVSTK